ncbi:MAG: cellulase family glycosylhydrolase [bacterium]
MRMVVGAGSILALVVAPGCSVEESGRVTAWGINLAGAEFGARNPGFSSARPGRHGREYIFPSEGTLGYYADRGLSLIRLPISWERLQAEPFGALDPEYSGRVLTFMDQASARGCRVVLDLHNYGRYREADEELVVGGSALDSAGLPAAALADLWLRLARRVEHHPALHALGLMNEPHDMGDLDWHATSGEVVAALRRAGHQMWIWVAGDGWSKAHEWQERNPSENWIHDPLQRVAYEAHVYWDADSSGLYRLSFAEEQRLDGQILTRGAKSIEPFSAWCTRNGVIGVIGEFGIPWNDAGWLPVLDGFLLEIKRQGLTSCAWAGGDWWGDYSLALGPRGGADCEPLASILRCGPGRIRE